MRIVVQRTFFEVVEEDSSQILEMAVKRAFSAPVTSSRRDEPPSSARGGKAESFDSAPDVAQKSQEAEDLASQESKTTVAIRSIPPHFTRDQLQLHLDAWGFVGLYDFLYLPLDFAKCQNFGYAFVNLTAPDHAQRIFSVDGHSWGQPGEGHAVVSWSLAQGLDLHIERYRNSPVMHDSMMDECKPIVLEGGVRIDFPPPTKTVQRLRRLRTRCGSRGRGVSASTLGGIPGMQGSSQAHHAADAPATPADSCVLLPGLSCAPGGEADAILASPLLAGLRCAGATEPAAAADQRQDEALSESSTTAAASPCKRTSWADLEDDVLSECSTQAPGYCSSAPSSDGPAGSSDGLAARRRGSDSSAPSWSGALLAHGLMPAPPGARPPSGLPELGSLVEVVGTYPSGAHAVVTAVDREEGTYKIQVMHNGCRTRRPRTIKCKHARLLRHAE